MSKTFENVHTEYGGSMIVREEGDCVSVSINMVNPSDTSIHIAPSDAPALALAILEAAGVEPDREPLDCQVSLGTIVADLQGAIQYAEALASANREQAKLEAEALELRKAWKLGDGVQVQKFEDLIEVAQEKWLAVARRAREINKEEK